MSVFRLPPIHPTAMLLLAACATLAGVIRAVAQDYSAEVTPAVQGLYAEAKAAQQAGKTSLAIAKYRSMLKLAPHLAPAYNNLGILYFNDRDYADAARVLEQGLKIDPTMNTAGAMLGISYFRLGRNDEAKAMLEKTLAANPGDDNAEMTLARVLIAMGQPDDATQRLRSYLARNPNDQPAWYLLGKTYLRLSEESLGKINTIDPNSVTAHEVAGEIDESLHNYDGALAEYKKAVDLGPDQPGTHYHLGNAYWLLEKYESAEGEFIAELRNDSGNCTAQWKLGNSMLAANQPATGALPYLNDAIKLCPGLMQAHVDRANALLKTDKPADALSDLQLAEKESPREPSIHFLLSKAYKALGKSSESREEIETYGRLQREASEAVAGRASDAIQIKSAAH